MSIITPEAGSVAAQALVVAGSMKGVTVDLEVVKTKDGLYGIEVGSPNFNGFYEAILPTGSGHTGYGADDSWAILDDWNHEREFFDEAVIKEDQPISEEVKDLFDKVGFTERLTLWQRIKAFFTR